MIRLLRAISDAWQERVNRALGRDPDTGAIDWAIAILTLVMTLLAIWSVARVGFALLNWVGGL